MEDAVPLTLKCKARNRVSDARHYPCCGVNWTHPRRPSLRKSRSSGAQQLRWFPTLTKTRRAPLFRRALVNGAGVIRHRQGDTGASHFRRRPPRLPPSGGLLRLPARLRASQPGLPLGLGHNVAYGHDSEDCKKWAIAQFEPPGLPSVAPFYHARQGSAPSSPPPRATGHLPGRALPWRDHGGEIGLTG